MTPVVWGSVLGAALASGVLLVARAADRRRPRLASRVLPHVRDLRPLAPVRTPTTSAARGVFGPLLMAAADRSRARAGRSQLGAPQAGPRGAATDRA